MSCENVQERISLLLDCKLPAGDREHVLAHINSCRQCGSRFESMQYMRSSLRNLARPAVPPVLAAQLRVMASHERARQVARRNFAARVAHWVSLVHLAFDNMMRPFAVPFTGGLLSALVIFSVLVPSLSSRHSYSNDPPVPGLTEEMQWGDPDVVWLGTGDTHAWLEPASALIYDNQVSLTLVIDERGRVHDYYLSGGELTSEMKSLILLSQFKPATVNGQPAWGLKQVVFSRGQHLRS
jgi:Putative zinc-finger